MRTISNDKGNDNGNSLEDLARGIVSKARGEIQGREAIIKSLREELARVKAEKLKRPRGSGDYLPERCLSCLYRIHWLQEHDGTEKLEVASAPLAGRTSA